VLVQAAFQQLGELTVACNDLVTDLQRPATSAAPLLRPYGPVAA
jgi:hypothetical protein